MVAPAVGQATDAEQKVFSRIADFAGRVTDAALFALSARVGRKFDDFHHAQLRFVTVS